MILNFWGPSCVPCREEFPLFSEALTRHAADGLAIVGVLYLDEPAGARAFVGEYGATWPTVVDPERAIARAYKVAARPQTYFVDREGILRSIQIGGLTEADLERQLAAISGS